MFLYKSNGLKLSRKDALRALKSKAPLDVLRGVDSRDFRFVFFDVLKMQPAQRKGAGQ